ncbi:OmpA family protein [Citreicella sp. C3M06]|nr:OmpA family protein [Salipiger sp. 1_MG-2023]MBU2961479.1 OmpA family protein [Citreicella sp. C3M06]MDO6584930.1 OmpA family protein [Salipiger sp. 1_MG-2023]
MGLPALAPAQSVDELSVEELKRLFQAQKQVFKEAEAGNLGATRGLRLVTVDDVQAESAAPQLATTAPQLSAPSPDTGVSIAATAAPGARPVDPNKPLLAAATDAPVVFGELAPELQVNLHIAFGFDSAAIADDQAPKLAAMCQALSEADLSMVRIVGHTDSSGTDAYNQRLSVLRAKEVARHLIEECGIPATKLQTVGMGEKFPFNKANPRADENRRVEFQALS